MPSRSDSRLPGGRHVRVSRRRPARTPDPGWGLPGWLSVVAGGILGSAPIPGRPGRPRSSRTRAQPPTAASDPPGIRTIALAKHYGDVAALRLLDLQVPRNSIFGLLGPTAPGKTTAIKLLLGLVRPTGGRAELFGMDSVTDGRAIRARVGYLG